MNRICKWLTVAVLRQSVVDVVTDHTGGGRTSTVQEARLLTSWVSSKFLLALFIMALIQTD